MLFSRLPRSLVAFLVALAATFVALFARGALRSADQWLYDVGIATRPVTIPDDMIVLGIDESFMGSRKNTIVPRDELAQLIENAAAGKPKAIALDVRLDSRLDISPDEPDARLRQALEFARQQKVPVVLSDAPATQIEPDDDSNSATTHGTVIPYFREVASTGNVVFVPDADGKIRQHPLELPESPSLPAQMALLSGAPKEGLKRLEAMTTPLDFAGPPGSIPEEKAVDFLDRPLDIFLKDKLVFIGETFPRSHQFVKTPYNQTGHGHMYRVELLAHATDSLRRGAPRFTHDDNSAVIWDFIFVFLGAWAVGLSAMRSNLAGVGAAVATIAIASACAALSAHHNTGLWGFRFHPATPFLLGMPAAATGGFVWRSIVQARELTRVRDTFGAYVGAQVLETLKGEMPELGGETRSIAVLFCDIRGFSTIAESMSACPKVLLDELNEHFTPLVAALHKRGAYVDNYVGDLVMALFGAPVSSGNYHTDVRSAVLAALDFVEIVEKRNAIRRANGQEPLEVGIGVHCGEAVVGNVGSKDEQLGGRIHYTAIGDVVNVASRIEGATRDHNVSFLVTRDVVEICGDAPGMPDWRRLGEVAVKGRVAPVEIFAIEEELVFDEHATHREMARRILQDA